MSVYYIPWSNQIILHAWDSTVCRSYMEDDKYQATGTASPLDLTTWGWIYLGAL